MNFNRQILKIILFMIAYTAVVVGITLIVVFSKNEPETPYDKNLIETRINILEQQNVRLQQDISAERIKSAKYLMKIDSLESKKQIIELKFVKIYEKIDAAPATHVVNEFDSIFSNNGIR